MEASRPVTVATGALGPVLAKLTDLLDDKYKLPMESRSDIDFIKSELEPVYSLLLTIWEREDLDEACKDWMVEARDLSYAMEDDIDDFMLGQEHVTSASLFKSLKIQVQGLLGRCCEKWKDPETSTSSKPTVDRRARFIPEDESKLLEIEKKKGDLIDLLDNHETVCIVGFAGMGKTTLADLVYRAIGETFECRAFVSLSPSLNMMEVLKTILEHVSGGAPLEDTNASDEQISDNIRNFLRDKRYIIVVDDIWHPPEELELIKKSLPKNNLGSRIVITTRIDAVAKKWRKGNDAFVYAIEGISFDAAEALSERIIQEPGKTFIIPSPEDRPCSAIAKMSSGIPLAVTCMSSAVKEQLSSEAHKRFELALSQALKGFIHISCMKPLVESLRLGYQSLTVCLKTCLLYCSIYPHYRRFERDDLIRIWIAERFVYEEDEARSYFDELVNWGYIRPGESGLPKAQKYEINPIMLAFLKCQSQIYDFLAPVDSLPNISSLYGRRIYRASVQGGLSSSDISGLDFSRTRSFVTFGCASLVPFERIERLRVLLLDENSSLEEMNSENDDQILRHDNRAATDELLFPRPRHLIRQACEINVLQTDINSTMLQRKIGEQQYLETLDISSTRIRQLPREIGKLHHLNTLNISNTKVTGLPRKIEELKLLKTLIMSNTKLKELPKEIWKLQLLNTLDVSNTVVPSLPKDIGELQHLKTLNISHTKVKEVPVEIGKLQDLKILDISNTAVAELRSGIWELQHLKILDLGNTKVAELPGEIKKLKQLENLDISNTTIAELPSEMWQLQHLSTLNLGNTSVTKIPQEIGNLKNLRTMDISNTVITQLPREIRELTSLETLYLRGSDVKELPWEASQLSDSLVVLVGKMDSHQMVKLPQGVRQAVTDNGILSSNLSIMLFGRSGMNWEPLSVPTLKIAKRHMSVPGWVKEYLGDISSLDISLWKLEDNDLEFLREMPHLRTLVIQLYLLPQNIITITGGGFARLENFHVDCRLPWVTFKSGAMPKLRCLEFKFYACRKNEDPVGIKHLRSLRRIVFQSVSPMYKSDAPGISNIINKVREEVRGHPNRITLCIDGVIQEIKICAHICEENSTNGAGSCSGSNANETSLPKTDTDDYRGNIIPVSSYYPFGLAE